MRLGEIEDVIRLGEIADGRAVSRAREAARANMRARNEMMLNAMSAQLNAQIAGVVQRAQAEASALNHYPPSQRYRQAQGPIIYGPLGYPMNKMTFIDGGASVRPAR